MQADKLEAFAADCLHDERGSLANVMAIGALVADLLRRQQDAHDRFADCFARFDSRKNRERYRRLFKERSGQLG